MRFLCVFALLLSAPAALATHLLGGYIRSSPVAGQTLTHQVTVTIYFNAIGGAPATATTTELTLCFGDNTTSQSAPVMALVLLPTDPAILVGTFTTVHQFSGPGVYTITLSQINRSLTRNITADQPLSLRTTLQVGPVTNRTPVLSLPATGLTFSNRQLVSVLLAATDADGDSLSYALATPLTGYQPDKSSCYQLAPVPKYQYPNDLLQTGTYRLNARTGRLDWNVPVEVGLYTAALTVSEWRAGTVLSQTQHEVMLTIVDRGGTPLTPPPYEPAQTDQTPPPDPDYASLYLNVSPNPATDMIQVDVATRLAQPIQLQLFDSQGRLLSTVAVPPSTDKRRYQFEVSYQAAGLYLIRAESNGQQVVRKVVKQ